jgi:DNA-binding IclR family transcriptional regulator
MSVLKTVAASGADGARVADISASTGLHRVTVHRLLADLRREGLIDQDERRAYHLGAEAWLLGHAANQRFDLLRVGRQAIERIEEQTHDTVYLLRRVPPGVFCVARRDGSYPIKSLVMDVGARYPLGIGAGGLAVLAFLSRREIGAELKALRQHLDAYPQVTAARVKQLLQQTQKTGYSYWPGLISEAHVVGVPIRNTSGEPIGALSCAAIKERLHGARRKCVVALLIAEAEAIGRQMPG